ncbi:MAG: amidohydrolase, partial [Saprospiraceae bacterium]
RLLVDRQGVSQILAGLDDPYPLGEMENEEGGYPGKVIDEAVQRGFITSEERDEIWCDNVANWLYGWDKEEFYTRIKMRN